MKAKHLIFTLLALLVRMTAFAQTWTWIDDNGTKWDFSYEASGSNATLFKGTYTPCISGTIPTVLTIPTTVYVEETPYNVTAIGGGAFYGCSSLTSITIPNSITAIGDRAFSGCTGLTSITMPSSVTDIGSYAFYGCTGLTSTINIPDGVTYIGSYAFCSCTGLTSIKISNNVTSIRDCTFAECNSLTSITIPNGVTSIGAGAFAGCSDLASITIPNGVTSIGENAFSGCSSLTSSINIPDGVTSIGNNTFKNCSSLTSVTIPNSVTTIGDYAFYGCSSLTSSINIPDGVTYIGCYAFQNCSSVTSITIPNSVRYLLYNAFKGCSGLTSINIPNCVTSIQESTFSGCSSLTSINIPEGVTSIGTSAFSGCTGLTSITIPSSVTSIDNYAFNKCTSLTSVTILNPTPVSIYYSTVFPSRNNATLYVPYSTKAAYEAATYWQDFKEIIETNTVNVGSTGFATYCSPNALDFSGVTDIKAYVASDFDSGTNTLTLTRVTEVPAGEGLYIVGTVGSYEIPEITTDVVYSNLMKGVTRATTISPTDGSNTNFILSNGSHGVGFYTLSAEGELAGGKAYLQLPTASVADVKALNLVFDDDATGIDFNPAPSKEERVIYNIAGQRVSKAQKGLYIIDGKKVFIK